MKLLKLYDLLAENGSLTPAEVRSVARVTEPRLKYQAVYSALRRAVDVGAVLPIQVPGKKTRYEVNPMWAPEGYRSHSRKINHERRRYIIEMRQRQPPVSYHKIAQVLGCSRQAVKRMHDRTRRGQNQR